MTRSFYMERQTIMAPVWRVSAPQPLQDTRPSTVPNFMPISGHSDNARAALITQRLAVS